MSRQEFYAAGTFSKLMNMLRDEKEQPFSLDWPWPDPDSVDDITPEEREQFLVLLKANSAFPQFRGDQTE